MATGTTRRRPGRRTARASRFNPTAPPTATGRTAPTSTWCRPAGGRARKLTRSKHALFARPGLPTARRIACLGRTVDAPAGANVRLWVVPATAGDPACVTAHLDISIGSDVLTDMRAGHQSIAAILDHGRYARPGADLRTRQRAGWTSSTSTAALRGRCRRRSGAARLRRRGDRIVFTASTPTDPGDVFAAADGSDERRLTTVNEALLDQPGSGDAGARWRSSAQAASRSRAGSCPAEGGASAR